MFKGSPSWFCRFALFQSSCFGAIGWGTRFCSSVYYLGFGNGGLKAD